MASPEPHFPDPYLDPETGILRNLVGAKTQAELDDAEFDLVSAAQQVLRESPPDQTLDMSEWRAIHKALFRDIYAWAGELRTVDIAKASGGIGFDFMTTAVFPNAIQFVESQIQSAFGVPRLDRDEFVGRLAEQYSNLNVLHPFREGSGRTQRFFWSQVAHTFGYKLNWLAVSQEENALASAVGAASLDYGPLLRIFHGITLNNSDRLVVTAGIKLAPSTSQVTLSSPNASGDLCLYPMPRAKRLCVLALGHGGHHRSKVARRA